MRHDGGSTWALAFGRLQQTAPGKSGLQRCMSPTLQEWCTPEASSAPAATCPSMHPQGMPFDAATLPLRHSFHPECIERGDHRRFHILGQFAPRGVGYFALYVSQAKISRSRRWRLIWSVLALSADNRFPRHAERLRWRILIAVVGGMPGWRIALTADGTTRLAATLVIMADRVARQPGNQVRPEAENGHQPPPQPGRSRSRNIEANARLPRTGWELPQAQRVLGRLPVTCDSTLRGASLTRPLHTAWFRVVSTPSLVYEVGCASGQRLRADVGLPPSSSGIR